jgi:HTH-type transcriptional regulator/antitoxin HipB
MKKYTLDQVKDQYIGPKGTPKREQYELELKMDIIGDLIRNVRKERNLTQSELGQLIGVQKAQISKLENNTKNVSIGTFLKVFEGLKAKIWLRIELMDKELEIN